MKLAHLWFVESMVSRNVGTQKNWIRREKHFHHLHIMTTIKYFHWLAYHRTASALRTTSSFLVIACNDSNSAFDAMNISHFALDIHR